VGTVAAALLHAQNNKDFQLKWITMSLEIPTHDGSSMHTYKNALGHACLTTNGQHSEWHKLQAATTEEWPIYAIVTLLQKKPSIHA
jgi:hypothetical protein